MSSTSLPQELSSHTSIFDPTTLVRKGLCPVSKLRHQSTLESHSLYFEQHGTGPERVLFVMGLNSSSFGWQSQIEHFSRLPGYSSLVFDNRGVGYSDAPRGPYSTSGMAEDVIVLLEYIGWTGQRDLHVVGISLGGMIAQELATRIPDRIVSLTLTVTTAGGSVRPFTNLPPWKGIICLTRLLTIKDPKIKVPITMDMLYPPAWLAEKAMDDAAGRTNLAVQSEIWVRRAEITRPQTLIGALSQMYAGLTHRVSPTRLATISSTIPKVTIVTGDSDSLVAPSNSKYMKQYMEEAEYLVFQETGHAINTQEKKRYNALLERVFGEGRERARNIDM